MSSSRSRTARSLLGVGFADEKSGWAVGAEGTLLHTSDGGIRWDRQESNTNHDIRAVNVLDAFSAFATGDRGLVLGFRGIPKVLLGVNLWVFAGAGLLVAAAIFYRKRVARTAEARRRAPRVSLEPHTDGWRSGWES